LGKQLRKVFKPKQGYIYVDADYSQIELRVLAHISQDENMVHAFLNEEDIHKQAASKVLNIPIEEVTKEQRSSAKAVNFGIVYGISDFGLSEQLGISKKEAKNYIEQYLEKYNGIDKFMKDIVEQAKKDGYVETLFNRRRYIPELSSNNYMVRQFGARAAMNTPIQGTAADIMKIAMVNLYKELKNQKLDAKIVLQIHDELMIECKEEECKKVEEILKQCMENAIKLSVPLEVEVSCAHNWYDLK
jgi:DNA polymerase-1